MKIGEYVENARFTGSLGVITQRPAVSGCWCVKWTRGKNLEGKTLISAENDLRVVPSNKLY